MAGGVEVDEVNVRVTASPDEAAEKCPAVIPDNAVDITRTPTTDAKRIRPARLPDGLRWAASEGATVAYMLSTGRKSMMYIRNSRAIVRVRAKLRRFDLRSAPRGLWPSSQLSKVAPGRPRLELERSG
jgi:hypothetical protein